MNTAAAIEPTALYTARDAARLLSVHPVTMRRLLRTGIVRGVKRAGWRISGAELLRRPSA